MKKETSKILRNTWNKFTDHRLRNTGTEFLNLGYKLKPGASMRKKRFL